MDCHTNGETFSSERSIALVGHQNVGKSVLFHKLTGVYAVVANYPGTTVEITRGKAQHLPSTQVIDTPGVVTLPPHTDDERATARVLLNEPLDTLLQVGDAKNLRRTLLLSIQLAEMGIPLVLALNMMDEADAAGLHLDPEVLARTFGIQVIPTTAIRNEGVPALGAALQQPTRPQFRLAYPAAIEAALVTFEEQLPQSHISRRAIGLLYLGGDATAEDWLAERLPAASLEQLAEKRAALQTHFAEPLDAVIQGTRLDFVDQLAPNAQSVMRDTQASFLQRFSQFTTHAFWGLPILALVLLGFYWLVGVFGAGTLVDLLESRLFGELINPAVQGWVTRLSPWPLLSDLLVGEYGLWTMGMTYALALILPIVTTFFLAFGLLEDSGYLPRLSVLTNKLFRLMGLNGKAVLPMVLGLGCVTMATLTTRIMENKRDRLLVILLLALAIPCSAQLGVVMGMLASISFAAFLIWAAVILLTLLIVGWLAARLLPGERTLLLVELPPLRAPSFANVVVKTFARLEWYLKEVVPLFLIGTLIMFLMARTGALEWLIGASRPLVTGWLGLPPEAAIAFVLGFLRRDFGATGLFVLGSQGLLNPQQVVVAMVTITLFIPCVASVFMIAKERGWRTSLALIAVIFPMAFLAGGLLSRLLALTGWGL